MLGRRTGRGGCLSREDSVWTIWFPWDRAFLRWHVEVCDAFLVFKN